MIKMITDDVIIRYNFISKLQFVDGNNVMPKDLKIKIMKMRIEYGKVNKLFEDDVQEFSKGIASDRFIELDNKQDKTKEEVDEMNSLVTSYNQEINEYIKKRCQDEVEVNEYSFSEDEFNNIIETNSENDVIINNVNLKAPDFLEELYNIFME